MEFTAGVYQDYMWKFRLRDGHGFDRHEDSRWTHAARK